MAFDKEAYWKNKPNNVGSKRPKPQIVPSGDAEVTFTADGMVQKSRRVRRQKINSNVFKRKGYIEHLDSIKIVRKKDGKSKIKYVKLTKSVI